MPATTVARLWHAGRRAWAFLVVAASPLVAQPATPPTPAPDRPLTQVRMTSVAPSSSLSHRLEWHATSVAVRKISVTSPRLPGLWLRITCDEPHIPSWWFVPLDSDLSHDVHNGSRRMRGSLGLHVDLSQTAQPGGRLPIVFTFTEG